MKSITLIVLTALGAVFFSACGAPPAANTAANANANLAAQPVVPSAMELFALDKQANEAYVNGDSGFFERFLSPRFVMRGPAGATLDKAATVDMIGGVRCDIKKWNLDEPRMMPIDAATYVLIYRGTFDGTCTRDGKTEQRQSPIRAATVWVREGDKWMAAFHGENPIVDPASAGPKAADKAAFDPAAAVRTTAAFAKTATSGDGSELAAIELRVWEAWKSRDRKLLEELTAKDLAFVDIFGNATSTRADTIKLWTEHNCDIQSVGVTGLAPVMLSPAVAILPFTGTAKGTCAGQKLTGPIYGTSVYVKEAQTWRLAFTFNSPK